MPVSGGEKCSYPDGMFIAGEGERDWKAIGCSGPSAAEDSPAKLTTKRFSILYSGCLKASLLTCRDQIASHGR
jgi:hypothetical protein